MPGKKGANHWTASELIKLRRLYPSASWEEIAQEFPFRSIDSIKRKVWQRKLYRPRRPLKQVGEYVTDEIRRRARELNISIVGIGQDCNNKYFFTKNHFRHRSFLRMNVVNQALAILGGRLKIEWED